MAYKYVEHPDSNLEIAYSYSPAAENKRDLPVIVFCGGFKSDMNGTKATYLEKYFQDLGLGYLRFDYSGHGRSGGEFENGCISDWKNDARFLIEHLGFKSIILVGSSMGGWISLCLCLELGDIVHGFVGIAAAPDFTDDIWFNRLSEKQRSIILSESKIELPNDYSDDPYILGMKLFEDGRNNFVLEAQQNINVPMYLVQGKEDPDVDWKMPERIQKAFLKADIEIKIIDDGDHSLSRPEDLDVICRSILSLIPE